MSLNPAIADLRQDYRQAALLESEADPNPIGQYPYLGRVLISKASSAR
jgi:hypothetical protein